MNQSNCNHQKCALKHVFNCTIGFPAKKAALLPVEYPLLPSAVTGWRIAFLILYWYNTTVEKRPQHFFVQRCSTQTNSMGSQLSKLQLSKHLDNLNSPMTDLFCCCVHSNRVNDCSIRENFNRILCINHRLRLSKRIHLSKHFYITLRTVWQSTVHDLCTLEIYDSTQSHY